MLELSLKEAIFNYKHHEQSSKPDLLLWLRRIGEIAAQGGEDAEEAEKFLVDVLEKSNFKERQVTVFVCLVEIQNPLPETAKVISVFKRDQANIQLFEQVLAGAQVGQSC